MRHERISISDKNADIIAYTLSLSEADNAQDISKMKKILSLALKDALTDKQRECITMYYYENLKMKEIAKKLSVSPSTVTRHIKAGKKRLKNIAKYY